MFLILFFILQFQSLELFAKIENSEKTSQYEIEFQEIIKGYDVIWSFDFISPDQIIFSERSGKLHLLDLKTKKIILIKHSINVAEKGQGGLLDVKVHPDFNDNKLIYLTYSKSVNSKMTTTLYKAQLVKDSLFDGKDVFVAKAESENSIHFGSRIAFDSEKNIYISIGDRNERDEAQSLKSHNGKILRLNAKGDPHPDNLFKTKPEALKEIFTYGHRNPQGLFFDQPTSQLWSAEFGPRGGDELNLLQMGQNYGWPLVTFGREYWGPKIGEGTSKKGLIDAKLVWNPSISPSGLMVYRGQNFELWNGDLFLACLSGQEIRHIKLNTDPIVQESFGKKLYERFRTIRFNSLGEIFVSTDAGKIFQIKKKNFIKSNIKETNKK